MPQGDESLNEEGEPCENIDHNAKQKGYYAMSGTSQKNSKIQKFKNSTVEKKNISLVQLTNAAISLLNW